MTDNVTDVLRRLRHADADRPGEVLALEWRTAVIEEIMRSPGPAQLGSASDRPVMRAWARPVRELQSRVAAHARRFVAAGALAGVVAAAATWILTASSSLAPQPASAAVVFLTGKHGEIVARIVNPFASARQLEAAFAAHGLHIRVQTLTAAPGTGLIQVRRGTTVVAFSTAKGSAPNPILSSRCRTHSGRCELDVTIPAHLAGTGYLEIYRPARPGEEYEAGPQSSMEPGQPLHCSHLEGVSTSAAIPVLKAHGLRAVWQLDTRNHGGKQSAVPPAGTTYVWAISAWAPGVVDVDVHRSAPPADLKAVARNWFDKGC